MPFLKYNIFSLCTSPFKHFLKSFFVLSDVTSTNHNPSATYNSSRDKQQRTISPLASKQQSNSENLQNCGCPSTSKYHTLTTVVQPGLPLLVPFLHGFCPSDPKWRIISGCLLPGVFWRDCGGLLRRAGESPQTSPGPR